MPSLMDESFGLVAAEAMLNGIPVLASNRGGRAGHTIGERRLSLRHTCPIHIGDP